MVGTKPTGMVRKLSSVTNEAFITEVVNDINTIPSYEGCSCRLSQDSSRCAERGPGHHGSRSSICGKAQGTFLLKDHDGYCLIKIAGGVT